MTDEIPEILREPPVVINVGVGTFAESLERQGIDVTQVNWSPPAGGDQDMMDLLEDLL